jgi:hypothetical protein
MRYRLKVASWTVVRQRGPPSPRILEDPAAVALLAGDLLRDVDDDREHFWAIYLDAKNHYLLASLVGIGTRRPRLSIRARFSAPRPGLAPRA